MRQPPVSYVAPPPPRANYITKSIPAPVGGLNAIDALAEMPPTDAIWLENLFPGTAGCTLRGGSASWATGFPGWVETVMAYNAPSSTKLFGIASGGIYDATAGGTVGAAAVSGLSNSRWEYVNFDTPAGQFLYAFNAVDSPQLFNGSTWQAVTGASTPIAITGVTTTKLRSPCVWMNRLFMVEDGTFHVWFLPIQSVGGAASQLDLSSYFTLGGQLQAIFTLSVTDANATSDYIAFLTSAGEMALFRGTDPAFAGSFGKVGQYRIGQPVGRRCVFRYGADTIVLCADGFVPVSAALMAQRDDPTKGLSYKLLPLVIGDVQQYGSNFGWQGVVYPLGNKLLINVPEATDSTSHQYAMNLSTHAWCKFSGWNAACFEVQGNNLFFGGNTAIARCDLQNVLTDNGLPITAKVKPAFSYFDAEGQQKQFKMVRPIYRTNGVPTLSVSVNVDFADTAPTQPLQPVSSGGSPWNTSPWNTSPWSPDYIQVKNWVGAAGVGFAGTVYVLFKTSGAGVQLQAIDYLYEVAKGNVM